MSKPERLHTACDECRTRKLKCTRETPSCARCRRENIQCVYSPRQQMGRPRKRRREDEAVADVSVELPAENLHDVEITLDDLPAMSSFEDFNLTPSSELHCQNGGLEDGAMSRSHQDLDFFNNTSTLTPTSNFDFSIDPPVDPSLWDPQSTLSLSQPQPPLSTEGPPSSTTSTPAPTSCDCLSLTYLTVTDLQSVPTFTFPFVVYPLRKAMTTLSTLIHCPTCPLDPFTAIQNLSSITALFKAIISRFSKVLYEVDLEAARLVERGVKKSYRIGDNSAALAHMHTGTPDCPMGIDIDLEPADWQRLAKTAIRMEVHGGGGRAVWLLGLLDEVEKRQQRWHHHVEFQSEERMRLFGNMKPSADGTCHALGADYLRKMIEGLGFE